MCKMKKHIILAIFLFIMKIAFAQDADTAPCGISTDKKALRLVEEAKKDKDYKETIKLVEEAGERDPGFGDAYFFLAERAKRKEDPKTAVSFYKKAIEACPEKYAD